jgi:hypothetical protein
MENLSALFVALRTLNTFFLGRNQFQFSYDVA